MSDELVGDLGQRYLSNVKTFARDQLKEKVKWSLENVQGDTEVIYRPLFDCAGLRRRHHGLRPHVQDDGMHEHRDDWARR